MGWKNVKDHYRIEHIVHVTSAGICIGSPYIPDIIVIGCDGALLKYEPDFRDEDLNRYIKDFKSDMPWLRELVKSPDTFTASIPVYTYEGGEIVEKFCEKPGWPNVTHDGDIQYENTFSTDKAKVVRWAKDNAEIGITWRKNRIVELKHDIAEIETDLQKEIDNLAKLEKDYQ